MQRLAVPRLHHVVRFTSRTTPVQQCRLIRSRPALPVRPRPNLEKSSHENVEPEEPVVKGNAAGTVAPKYAVIITTTLAGILGLYAATLLTAALKPCPNPAVSDPAQQKDVAARYDSTADSFDSEVGLSEMLMGVNTMRKQMANKCLGHVLEVSCGTGRNLGYYDIWKNPVGKVDSLTFVDLSPQMVDVCKKKWDILTGRKHHKLKPGLIIRFAAASALGEMPLAPTSPTPQKYDTVIQTMGLCSTDKPVDMLVNIVQYLNTSNPDARIYLLEHGRSHREWMNNILDKSAEKHAEIHGCWFNRDISGMVKEAADRTGLDIVVEKRYHVGTTLFFELKSKVVTAAEALPATAPPQTEPEAKSKGWFGFLK
jgi:methyltransferase OMS1